MRLLSLATAALSLALAARAAPEDPPRQGGSPAGAVVAPQEDPTTSPLDAGAGAHERVDRSLRRGLDWLAAQQERVEDGSLPSVGGRRSAPVPVTALAALAFLSAGSSAERGPHGRHVARAIDYLLDQCDLVPGSPVHGYVSSEGDSQSRMHGHGFAALALSQAWSMSPRTPRGQRIEQALVAATRLIEATQGLEGGWFYDPRKSVQHENSVTVVLVQALRAAKDAGVAVDADAIRRAVDYIRRCQSEDGSFRYALGSGETSVALTAAGVSILNSAGVYSGGELDRAVEALWRRLGYREDAGDVGRSRFPCYERFYLAQALWQHSDARLFERWYAGERERVLAAQRPDGSWQLERDPSDDLHEWNYGACYATAMNCLFLAIPDGLLPIFQR